MKFFSFKGQRNLCGTVIRMERKKRKMSQQELVSRMNLFGLETNINAISHIEQGTRILTDYELIVLSRIFGIPVSSFFREVHILSNKELEFNYTPLNDKAKESVPETSSENDISEEEGI